MGYWTKQAGKRPSTGSTMPAEMIVSTPGAFSYLLPTTISGDNIIPPGPSMYGPGMYLNVDTGRWMGTSVYCFESASFSTVTLSTTSDAVANMALLQTAVDNACSSMTQNRRILLPSGSKFSGQLVLRANNTGYRYNIYWAGYTTMPSVGAGDWHGGSTNRINAAYHGSFPEFYNPGNEYPIVVCDNGARGCDFRGIEFSNYESHFKYTLLSIASNNQYETVRANFPKDIRQFQCLYQGGGNMIRGVYLSGEGLAVVDGYADHTDNSGESQFVYIAATGRGPYKVANTYSSVDGGSENVLVGGAGYNLHSDDSELASDIEIAGNLFDKPSFAPGSGHAQKNMAEAKIGRRIAMVENVCKQNNGGGQVAAFVIKSAFSDGDNGSLAADLRDVIVANNWVPEGPGGAGVTGRQACNPLNLNQTRRVAVINNLFAPTLTYRSQTPTGAVYLTQIDGTYRLEDLIYRWNTGVSAEWEYCSCAYFFTGESVDPSWRQLRADLSYNVLVAVGASRHQTVQGENSNYGYGQTMFDYCVQDGRMVNNLVSTLNSNYTNQIRVSDPDAVGFVDRAGRDFRLASSSPGYQAGPGGKTLGADFGILNAVRIQVTGA